MNAGAIIMIIALFAAGFAGSFWFKSQVESAGYIYCREASGISALAKSLVYTKDMAICEDFVTAKYKHRKQLRGCHPCRPHPGPGVSKDWSITANAATEKIIATQYL